MVLYICILNQHKLFLLCCQRHHCICMNLKPPIQVCLVSCIIRLFRSDKWAGANSTMDSWLCIKTAILELKMQQFVWISPGLAGLWVFLQLVRNNATTSYIRGMKLIWLISVLNPQSYVWLGKTNKGILLLNQHYCLCWVEWIHQLIHVDILC